MDPRYISGSLKAAILIRSLDSEVAGMIFNSLSENEKQVVQAHLDRMGVVSADVVEYIAKEFINTAAMRTHVPHLTPPAKPEIADDNDNGEQDQDQSDPNTSTYITDCRPTF